MTTLTLIPSSTTLFVSGDSDRRIDFLQSIVDRAYDKYPTNSGFGAFLEVLAGVERQVVAIGKLNGEVTNGGFAQWIDNGYCEGVNHLADALQALNTDTARKVLSLVGQAMDLHATAEEPEPFYGCTCGAENDDECYCSADEGYEPSYDHLDDAFYTVNDQLMRELAVYLATTYPEEYAAWVGEQTERIALATAPLALAA